MKKIKFLLRRGVQEYKVKLGAPRSILRVAPYASNMVAIIMLVDPSIEGAPCHFYVVGEGDTLPVDPDTNEIPSYFGAANDLDVFTDCFKK
jgi:hypothetical protein